MSGKIDEPLPTSLFELRSMGRGLFQQISPLRPDKSGLRSKLPGPRLRGRGDNEGAGVKEVDLQLLFG
ncbi:MAG TPA: hypothetical protein HPP87_04980 [Planctomycetes bacterium]|nr:hypothetical protein [Planctomycetota bacterium]